MPVDPDKIAEITSAIEKEYKDKRVHRGSEYQRRVRIPFDAPQLNVATGGGIPMGAVSRIWGKWSAGKTYNSLVLAKNAQNIHIIAQQMKDISTHAGVQKQADDILRLFPEGMTVMYHNVEGGYDEEFAKRIGVDVDKLLVVEGSRIEEIAEAVEAYLGAVHFQIIDSASAASPMDRLKSDISDWDRGLHARVWNKALDHIKDQFDGIENSVLVLDQVRINQMTGSDMAAGGQKMDHESHMTIQFKRKNMLYAGKDGSLVKEYPQKDNTPSGKAEAVGMHVAAEVKKSRAGRAFRVAYMDFDARSLTYNIGDQLADLAVFLGVVEQNGSWYILPDGVELDGKKSIQGKPKLAQLIDENLELKQDLLAQIYAYCYENP